MTVERALRLIAGVFVTASVLLGLYVDHRFLWFTLFVGLNLFQSGFTNWCGMMTILRRTGVCDRGRTVRKVSPNGPGETGLGLPTGGSRAP
jgi:hypothetical protein